MTHAAMKLGKLPHKHDPRTLRLARYLCPGALPTPPDVVDWTKSVAVWPMYQNDALGDCTCAAVGHHVEAWTGSATGTPTILSDADVLVAYEAVGGYVPGKPETDQGAVELDVLNYWRGTGIGDHKIGAFASIDLGRQRFHDDVLKVVNHLFGGAYVGLMLPLSAQDQAVWDVPADGVGGEAGSWGGHAVNLAGYNAQGPTCVTWGDVKQLTWAFWHAYADEAWAVFSPDFLKGSVAPNGFDVATLQRDLALVTTA